MWRNQNLPYITADNIKWCHHFGKVWQFLKWLNIELPYDQAISLLGIYSRAIKQMFTQKFVYECSEQYYS